MAKPRKHAVTKEDLMEHTIAGFEAFNIPELQQRILLKPYYDPDYDPVKQSNGITSFADFSIHDRHPAGVLHDWRYTKGTANTLTRKEADREFKLMLTKYHWPRFLCKTMYIALRVFGGLFWKK